MRAMRERPDLTPALAMLRVPSPTTWPGVRRVAATSTPLTTSSRWSSPVMKLSTSTERETSCATLKAVRTASSVLRWIATARP